MNPLPLAWAEIRAARIRSLCLALLIALSVAMSVGIAAQERAIRSGSARAADAFDLVVGAQGSATQLILSTVYLQAAALPLLPGSILQSVRERKGVEWAAPIVFGDSFRGMPIVGTSADFVLSGGKRTLAEGRLFKDDDEAVAGALSGLKIGDEIVPTHGPSRAGHEAAEGSRHDGVRIKIVGRLPVSGTPWDKAVLIPIETVWAVHGLSNGHRAPEHRIGPPWDGEMVPGVAAIVIKPVSVADAYRLRSLYRTPTTQALFPAEVLIELYRVLSDVGKVVGSLALASQLLVLIAILVAVAALIATRARQIAALQAMGAPRTFIFAAVWIEIAIILIGGTLLGIAGGYFGIWVVARLVQTELSLALPVSLAASDIASAITVVGAGLLLAAIPARLTVARPVSAALKSEA